jgi:arginase
MTSVQEVNGSSSGEKRNVSYIGIPFNGGQPKTGVEKAPTLFREQGVQSIIESLGWNFIDRGDVVIPSVQQKEDSYGNTKRPNLVGAVNKLVFEKVYEQASKGDFVFNLGGDHSTAVGSIAGMLAHDPETCVIWVDAHADINTHETSISGNIHGMPVAFLLGLPGMRETPGFEWLSKVPKLKPEKIAYIGLRDLDFGEKVTIRSLGITAFSMHEVDKYGIGAVVDMAVKKINPALKYPIHLSFDIDGIDSLVVPSTGTPVIGGLSPREARYICQELHSTNRLKSFDLVEVNPLLSDEKGQQSTIQTSLLLINAAFGQQLV